MRVKGLDRLSKFGKHLRETALEAKPRAGAKIFLQKLWPRWRAKFIFKIFLRFRVFDYDLLRGHSMPYQRTNYKVHELKIALANPVSSQSGPHAHSNKHAVSGELANHPLFQKARVSANVYQNGASDANRVYHMKSDGVHWDYNSATRHANPIPKPEVGRHSAVDVNLLAPALRDALNHASMQPHLGTLDGGTDMKVHVNFTGAIGQGYEHTTTGGTAPVSFVSLFVYCKPNTGNRDIPIFQTVVPATAHKVGGHDPIITLP